MHSIFKSELITCNSILLWKLWQPFAFCSITDYHSMIDSTRWDEMSRDALEKPREYS